MNIIIIGLLLREALDRLCVRLNMYLVDSLLVKEVGAYVWRLPCMLSDDHFYASACILTPPAQRKSKVFYFANSDCA